MEYKFILGTKVHQFSLEKKDDRYVFLGDNVTLELDIRAISPQTLSLLLNGHSHRVHIVKEKDKKFVHLDGRTYLVRIPGEEEQRSDRGEDKAQKGKSVVTAPMPGKVIKISVAEKDAVRKNQTLAIVEAMKMENEIKSPVDGFVKKICVSAGDLVDADKPLLELEPKV
jgi:biotin carboxyl carrier protein